jgi:two-component system phosphate regulon sensor histidine kinase PhoR
LLRIRRKIINTQPDPDRRLEFNRARLEGARWVLEAVHRSGSLAAAVQAATVRNILVSFGILALLSTALVVLSIAVRRKEELTERRREFIASVTHELKTPVAVILSAVDNLAAGIIRDAAKTAAYGVAIRDQGRRLSDMIDRLLVYARIGDGRPRLEDSLSLREVCERVLQEYGGELAAAHFRLEAPFRQDARVRGDAAALELAFGNLVANALKHGREGGFLGLDLRTEAGKWALVSFRDHGPGVKRQERKLIFEAFYRGERARSDQLPGSGLGLNLVRRIVAAHGGTVGYEALGDLGAQFIVRLPLEAAGVWPAAHPAGGRRKSPGHDPQRPAGSRRLPLRIRRRWAFGFRNSGARGLGPAHPGRHAARLERAGHLPGPAGQGAPRSDPDADRPEPDPGQGPGP